MTVLKVMPCPLHHKMVYVMTSPPHRSWFTLIILQRMSKESFWYKNLFYNEYLKKSKLYFVANLQFFLILKLDCNKGLWDNIFTFTFKCIIISNHHMREAGNFVWKKLRTTSSPYFYSPCPVRVRQPRGPRLSRTSPRAAQHRDTCHHGQRQWPPRQHQAQLWLRVHRPQRPQVPNPVQVSRWFL